MSGNYPDKRLEIVGGGILAAIWAYYVAREAKLKGETIRLTIHDQLPNILDTTASRIAPSLTPDEMLAVVPRGLDLVKSLAIPFYKPDGIRVDDVKGINGSSLTEAFKSSALAYSQDEHGHQQREKTLLKLGALSMALWDDLYNHSDPELRQILIKSNYHPCREPDSDIPKRGDGYRIDIIFDVPNAKKQANGMIKTYNNLGYHKCKILTPDDVCKLDPSLTSFCERYTIESKSRRKWKNTAVALLRPGGCIDASIFLPLFYDYLEKMMGTYVNDKGDEKSCFHLKLASRVTGVSLSHTQDTAKIESLMVRRNGKSYKRNDKHPYKQKEYVFCPGESVGTLKKFGFCEPAYTGFAGASLMLNIPIPKEISEEYDGINHFMEVHQKGVVLAWQARKINNHISIKVGGTKALYADIKPELSDKFAQNRNLLQLNIINKILPQCISLALGRDTDGKELGAADLAQLVENKIATRWVGRRAVTYDGFPTTGILKTNKSKKLKISNSNEKYKKPTTKKIKPVINGYCTTHAGSGGVANAPGLVKASQLTFFNDKKESQSSVMKNVAAYSDCAREPNRNSP